MAAAAATAAAVGSAGGGGIGDGIRGCGGESDDRNGVDLAIIESSELLFFWSPVGPWCPLPQGKAGPGQNVKLPRTFRPISLLLYRRRHPYVKQVTYGQV